MDTHAGALCKKNKFPAFTKFKTGICTAVLFFMAALFFSGNTQAQAMNEKIKPVTAPHKTSIANTDSIVAIAASSACSGCDGKVINANQPLYQLVTPPAAAVKATIVHPKKPVVRKQGTGAQQQ
jgi:hypothetical protein